MQRLDGASVIVVLTFSVPFFCGVLLLLLLVLMLLFLLLWLCRLALVMVVVGLAPQGGVVLP
jgi:hypothetical protein